MSALFECHVARSSGAVSTLRNYGAAMWQHVIISSSESRLNARHLLYMPLLIVSPYLANRRLRTAVIAALPLIAACTINIHQPPSSAPKPAAPAATSTIAKTTPPAEGAAPPTMPVANALATPSPLNIPGLLGGMPVVPSELRK